MKFLKIAGKIVGYSLSGIGFLTVTVVGFVLLHVKDVEIKKF